MKNVILIVICASILQSCTKVDDYLLGKDNTPKPTALEKITPKVNLVKKWSSPVGRSHKASAYLKLKPVIRDQVIYIADASGQINAIDKADAHVLWSTHLKQDIVSGPTISENAIAVTTGNATLVLMDRTNGKKLWEKKLSSESLAKPAISSAKVIVKTIDGNLYAFNANNGKKIWTVNHGAPNLILKASSSPIISGEMVLAGYSDGKFEAVDIKTGRVLWQRSIAYAKGASDVERLVDIDADPIVKGNVAYLATYQGYVGALSLQNGQFIWSKPASVYKNLTLKNHTLYMTDNFDVVWAMDANTGQVKWKQANLKARGLTEPVMMGNQLVVGDKMGMLHVLAANTGELLGRTKLTGSVDISPVTENKTLFVQTANGLLNQLAVS